MPSIWGCVDGSGEKKQKWMEEIASYTSKK